MGREVYALRPIRLKEGGVAQRGDVIDISDWPSPRAWFENGMISYDAPLDTVKKKAAKKAQKASEEVSTPDEGTVASVAADLPPAAVGAECPYCTRHHRSEDAAAKCAKRASEAAA